jgi:hypothetical protein
MALRAVSPNAVNGNSGRVWMRRAAGLKGVRGAMGAILCVCVRALSMPRNDVIRS